jgi:hypothetical protein
MIASDMANPTKLSMKRLIWATRYIKGKSTYGCVTKRNRNTSASQWRHFTDSDQGKDQSSLNKGKARCGHISVANGFPVFYKSKSTSVAMAHPIITEGHADVSSAACEIYGAAQATFNILYLSYPCSRALRAWKIWARLRFLTSEAEAEANPRQKLPAQNPKS